MQTPPALPERFNASNTPLNPCLAATHRTKEVGDVCGVDIPPEPQHVTGFRSRVFADGIR